MSGEKQSASYEHDYLIRTLGNIAHVPDYALTELVANSWDAGASEVRITIPEEEEQEIIISDDGVGLTEEMFRERWMRMAYDRIKHQGRQVEFPPERSDQKRVAFGRNGVGRHGMLCFADSYIVETSRNSTSKRFHVRTSQGKEPFLLESVEDLQTQKDHGTSLKAKLVRHLPNADAIREILSVRFIHDPTFRIFVNGREILYSDNPHLIDSQELSTENGLSVECRLYDATKSARTKQSQGVAFWVGGRLVGEPTWVVGGESIIDARTQFGKRYTIVAQADELIDEILPDWSGFQKSQRVDEVQATVATYVSDAYARISKERITETKENVFKGSLENIRTLPPSAMNEIGEFVDEIVAREPTIKAENLSLAVDTLIKLQQSKSGKRLLEKLSQFDENDYDSLDRFLDEWSLEDAWAALEELDRRIAVIEAIAVLSKRDDIDELHTLHPLVTEARWLFGPEYESSEYSSNQSLKNTVKKVFAEDIENEAFENFRKRPDLLLLKGSTLSAVALEEFDEENELTSIKEVLLIELKRGGFPIGRPEQQQAQGYIEDIIECGLIENVPKIRAFVVGHTIKKPLQSRYTVGEKDQGVIYPTTFGKLVDTANRRLLNLRSKLDERYDGLTKPRSTELRRLLEQPEQRLLTTEQLKQA